MNAWFEAQIARYGAVALGLAIGTAARYGLALSEGRALSFRGILADLLLMGMVALIALFVTDRMNLTGNSATLCAALFALASDRVIRLARERFLRRVEASLLNDVERAKGELRNAVQTEMSAKRLLGDVLGDGE